MPFRIDVHLLDPSYQASTLDRGAAEWPPHPYRVFCGLVSVADPRDPVQDAALQWLEQQPAPTVRVPEHTAEAEAPRGAWVPTNAVEKKPAA
ncbi:type I-U CRISPR-associated protein Csb2 [Streptomyces sp. NBC_00826]|uniref:type I-G CRISPR-associated protein Csb2 n=1 Tax=Streptomyces sp. NBC_00826 TaxID=2975845 RepID=UPI002F907E33|nr:type I-U CRISPR-associated protein Csb2 [Streptomyces sp. NBC_00826]WTB60583.1 type I-U CRISPR-associated protein Csb2 [Streptomyces sp. NBC_00826]